MNHLIKVKRLHNRYFVQRHGESLANRTGIILSHPIHGKHKEFGLTDLGRQQVKIAAEKAKQLDSQTIIYSSDFSRARETAKITQSILKVSSIHFTRQLRERFFGKWERTNSNNYHQVWADDRVNSHHKNEEVESTQEVLDRATALILNLEHKYKKHKILLVGHGDVLQILQSAFKKNDPAMHRSLPSLETAEIRELKLTK